MPFRSGTVYRAYRDFECDLCFCDIYEGDDFGYVDGEKVCEPCWDAADDGDPGWHI